MRRVGSRLAIAVLALAGVYLFAPAFAATEYRDPDHQQLADEVRSISSQILDRLDVRSDEISGGIAGARDLLLSRIHSRTDGLSDQISGNVLSARDVLLSRIEARTNHLSVQISGNVFGARDTLLTRLNARTDDISDQISGTIAAARQAILMGIKVSATDIGDVVAENTRPATLLAARTNTYRNWLFAAGSTAPDQTLSFTLFSDTPQTVKAFFYTDTGTIGPIDLPLRAKQPFVLRANELLGVRNAVTTRFSGESAFHVERTFTSRGGVVITSGEHD